MVSFKEKMENRLKKIALDYSQDLMDENENNTVDAELVADNPSNVKFKTYFTYSGNDKSKRQCNTRFSIEPVFSKVSGDDTTQALHDLEESLNKTLKALDMSSETLATLAKIERQTAKFNTILETVKKLNETTQAAMELQQQLTKKTEVIKFSLNRPPMSMRMGANFSRWLTQASIRHQESLEWLKEFDRLQQKVPPVDINLQNDTTAANRVIIHAATRAFNDHKVEIEALAYK